MKGEHLNFDQRKIINSLSQNKKLCEIVINISPKKYPHPQW